MRRAFVLGILLLILALGFGVQAQETLFTVVNEIDVPGVAEGLYRNMSLSPDGRLAAVIFSPIGNVDDEPQSFEGVVLYDTQTGDALVRLSAPEVRSSAFSPDSSLFAFSAATTVVLDVEKLLAFGDITASNVEAAAGQGVIRNLMPLGRHMTLVFTPDNRALYGGDVAGRFLALWDISAPTDFSDPENVVYPENIGLTTEENHRLLPLSIVSSAQGMYAVTLALLEEERPGFGVFEIASDGTLTPVGVPYDAYAGDAYNAALGFGAVSASGRTLMIVDNDDEGSNVLLMRMQDDSLPVVLSTLRVGQEMQISLTPGGGHAVYSTQTEDGRALRVFHALDTASDVAELEVIDATYTEMHFSTGNRFAVLEPAAEKLIIYDAVGLDLSATDSQEGSAGRSVDTLALGMGVPVITDPEDCAADAPDLTGGGEKESTCVIGVDPLAVDTPYTLESEDAALRLRYPSVMALEVDSPETIYLASRAEVLPEERGSLPELAPGEAIMALTLGTAEMISGTEADDLTARGLIEILAEQSSEDLTLDGAIIDVYAGDYKSAVSYFTAEEGSVMLLVAALGDGHYAMIVAVSAAGELALVEPTIYEIANTFVYQRGE